MSKKGIFHNILTAFSVAVMSAALAVSAFAASGKISFSDPQVNSGQEVNVTMKIAAEEGTRLQDATVTLKYPSDQLTFVNGTDADGGAGTIRVHGASNGKGTAVLEYNLKFQTSGAGAFPIKVDTHEVYDSEGQAVEMTHLGSSNVQVVAPESVSRNSALAMLEVSPGSLDPAFSKDVAEYSVTVGTGVDQLAVNAQSEDAAATIAVDNNANFQMGDNVVTVKVTAPDGETVSTYTIHVIKQEGGAENVTEPEPGVTTIEGVQLSSKGKTITIMNPSRDVQIPDGFRQGTISIDGQKVQGWVWGADSDPKYCVVYGMNDQGELNFYRYDMAEKTIQRYFEDPLSADSVSNKEYTELKTELDELNRAYDIRFLIICILAVLVLVLLIANMYFLSKLRSSDRESRSAAVRRRRGEQPARRAVEPEVLPEEDFDNNILKHDYDAEAIDDVSAFDETQVISREAAEAVAGDEQHDDMGDTMMISRIHETQAADEAEPVSDTAAETEDDEFETFDL